MVMAESHPPVRASKPRPRSKGGDSPSCPRGAESEGIKSPLPPLKAKKAERLSPLHPIFRLVSDSPVNISGTFFTTDRANTLSAALCQRHAP